MYMNPCLLISREDYIFIFILKMSYNSITHKFTAATVALSSPSSSSAIIMIIIVG